jgi:hypothetical protein
MMLVGQENVTQSQVAVLVRLGLSFFRTKLPNSVPAHLCVGLAVRAASGPEVTIIRPRLPSPKFENRP